jgi:type II secretory pathway pseudopilin PulG
MTRRLRLLISNEDGFGLIELTIALMMLVVGIAGTMSVFAGSILALQHSSQEGTALTLADRQLEAYRSLDYSCVPAALPASIPSGCQPYTAGAFPNPYEGSHDTTASESPDHKAYTVTTTIATVGSSKKVTVSVTLQGASTVLAREASYFSSAGESGAG